METVNFLFGGSTKEGIMFLVFMLIMVVLNGYGMSSAYFFLPEGKRITLESIEHAYHTVRAVPSSQTIDRKKVLSEVLYSLSIHWNESWSHKGLAIANLLIQEGADLDHKKIIIEESPVGNSSTFKNTQIEYTHSAREAASGSLKEFFLTLK